MTVSMYANPNVATGTHAPAAADNSSASKAHVDYQSFLKLLVAEMKYQDPTNPMDSTDYIAQLASFSQVEQSIQINSKLDQMLQSSALAQGEAMIGRTITSPDGLVSGTVKEIKLFSDGILAILEDGGQVPVTPGVTIG